MVEECPETIMATMAKLEQPYNGSTNTLEVLEHLKTCLENISCQLAAKFGVVDCKGNPRIAYVLDALLRYRCIGCIFKALTQMRGAERVDTLYQEMHELAASLLVDALRETLNGSGFSVSCEAPVDYGRADVLVRPTRFGAVIQAGDISVIVEVKTGKSLRFAQLLKYLLSNPKAVMVVWRVSMHQIFILNGEGLRMLLCLVAISAVNRALRLLKGEHAPCEHNSHLRASVSISDPQGLLNEYFEGLLEGLPKVVSTVSGILKERNVHG